MTSRPCPFPLDDPSFDLLGPIGADDATVVALGLSVRGARTLVRCVGAALAALVERHGFRAVSIEGTTCGNDTAAALDRYVTTGDGDPEALLRAGQSFLRSRETLEVIEWLRTRNAARPGDAVRIVHEPDPTRTPGTLEATEQQLAETVLGWRERTGDRIAHWGGVAHTVVGDPRTVVQGDSRASHRNAGGHWRAALDDRFVSVALTLHAGAALGVPPVPPSFTEAAFAELPWPVSFVPLRGVDPAWFTAPLRTRCLGPAYDPARDAEYRVEAGAAAVDAVLHARDSAADHPLTTER